MMVIKHWRKRLVVIFLIMISSIIVAYQSLQALEQADTLDYGPVGKIYPFPPENFDFPQSAQTIQQWVNARAFEPIRKHSWYLFAGLNKPTAGPGSLPVWRTWNTATQAFDTTGISEPPPVQLNLKARNRQNGSVDSGIIFPPSVLPHYVTPNQVVEKYTEFGCINPETKDSPASVKADGKLFQNNGDIMVAGVIYNQPAFNWIRNNQLFVADKLTDMLPTKDSSPATRIGEFPADSIMLKPMMWPIKGDGFTALPVWTQDKFWPPNFDVYSGYEVQVGSDGKEKWSRGIAVTTDPNNKQGPEEVSFLVQDVFKPGSTTKLWGPNTYKKPDVHTIDEFYHFTYSKKELEALDPCDRAILDQSSYWTFGREFRAGDYLALIAMHIMTKEQPTWTFQTVWWSDKPEDSTESDSEGSKGSVFDNRFAGQRPDIPKREAPTTWKNYLMANTYGILQLPTQEPKKLNIPFVYPTDLTNRSRKWPVIYNPYIELVSHPLATNCMNCHMRAAWPPDKNLGNPVVKDFDRAASYLVGSKISSQKLPDSLDALDYSATIFDGLLMTDSAWAITDRAN